MAQRGGKRPGAGRKKGSRDPKVLERDRVMAALKQRIMQMADKIVDKQLVLVNGQQYLFKIEKEFVKTGTNRKTGADNGYYRNLKPELVENMEEIRAYLERLSDEANGDIEEQSDPSATYYFMTVKEPDNKAIDSLLDRAFGKATQSTKLVDDNDNVIPITSINVVPVEISKSK